MKFEGYLYDIIDARDSVSMGSLAASEDGSSVSADNPAASRDAAYAFRISLRPGSPIYAGHFPGFPITPGVALLTIVRELLERRLTELGQARGNPARPTMSGEHISLTLASADDVKFLHPLTPDHNPVTITFKNFQNGRLKAEITSSAAIHARMTLSYNML